MSEDWKEVAEEEIVLSSEWAVSEVEDEDEWGFSLDDLTAPSEPAKNSEDQYAGVNFEEDLLGGPSQELSEAEEDWDFGVLDPAYEDEWNSSDNTATHDEAILDPTYSDTTQDFFGDEWAPNPNEAHEESEPNLSSWEELGPDDDSVSLQSLVDSQSDFDADDTAEPDEVSETSGWKTKLASLKAQIKSELRGGDEIQERENSDVSSGDTDEKNGVGKKLASPYLLVSGLFLKVLLAILSPLNRIPFMAGKIANNVVLRTISYILPLALVVLVLQWQGSKELPPVKDLTFPDGGRAGFSSFGYDRSTGEAYGTITNEGDVIAEVTPSFTVYSLQYGINPLSFFFAKPEPNCTGKPVRVDIEKEKTVRVKCELEGRAKKVTGKLEW